MIKNDINTHNGIITINSSDIGANTLSPKVHSNIDAYYGPWSDDNEVLEKIPERFRAVGLTVGIYTDDNKSKIKEKWFQKKYSENGEFSDNKGKFDWELESKIEEYELILDTFEAEADEINERILIRYKINGKALLPKVSISGTNVNSKAVNFETLEEVEVPTTTPGTYSFTISVSDVLGTPFSSGGKETTINVSYGTIIAGCNNTVYISKLPPQQSAYEKNIPIGVYVNYNTDKITNVQIWLNNTYQFQFNEISPGKISSTLILPNSNNGNPYLQGENKIKVLYNKKEESGTFEYPIYSFNILLEGYYALTFPNEIPSYGYSGTGLNFITNINYGGGEDTSQQIKITLNNQNPQQLTLPLNSNINITYKLPTISNFNLHDSKGDYVNATLKVEITGENVLATVASRTTTIKIYKVDVPKVPSGEVYFNANYDNITPQTNNTFANIIPSQANEIFQWNSPSEEVVSRILGSFNIDFCIRTSQNGSDTPLITIKRGGEDLLVIGKQKISSPILFPTLQENNLTLPTDGSYVHIGFGYQRKFIYNNSNNSPSYKFYTCIFINGEIAFSTKVDSYNSSYCSIFFNDVFNLSEFSFNGATEIQDSSTPYLSSCINLGRELQDNYILGSNLYDVFYYNWLTTLTPETQPSNSNSLTELQLVPFLDSGRESSWWTILRADIKDLGSPIKKLNNFVQFGNICREDKLGIEIGGKLFDFTKDDKESKKLDKKYAVICKYRFVNNTNQSNFDENKFCIVQVQGTSTLAYPEPNLQFTFIKYEGGHFVLDDSVSLTYQAPLITTESTIEFESRLVEGETNLVAKADSMDSSHLNNTPTCIYLNSLIEALKNDNNINSKFSDTDLDAIVGYPILIKIDSRDGIDEGEIQDRNISVSDNINYNQFGTFMFNTGKSANNMGLNNPNSKVFSLEGQSNENIAIYGSPGIFTLPNEEALDQYDSEVQSQQTEEIDENLYRAALESFRKIRIICETINDSKIVRIEELNQLTNQDKSNIMNYLINSSAFESRSIIEDEDMQDPENWDLYGKHVVRMWLFVNQIGTESPELFREYFSAVFDLDYAILYYIHLLLFGQADNLGKNMMIDCKWNEDYTKEIWFIREYDLDSENGLTNNGFDNFPVYGCISEDHFKERFIGIDNYYLSIKNDIPSNTYDKYNSSGSILWTAFWSEFKKQIEQKYSLLRTYVTPEKIINIGKTIVTDHISKEQYNIDFSLKHLGTEYIHLNKGSRLLNYEDWITKRFMYVDSYFSYFKFRKDVRPSEDINGDSWKIGKTLVPIFYEANYQEPKTRYGIKDFTYESPLNGNMQYVFHIVPEAVLSMSPVWGDIKSSVESGEFKNLQNYSGTYSTSVFSSNYLFKNLLSIDIKEINKKETTEDLYIPDSVNTLSLDNLIIDNNIYFGSNNNSQNSNIEKIILKNCDIQNLTLGNLPLLKQLIISNCNIENLTLQNLKLSILDIDNECEINVLSIMGQTTENNELDFSGKKINNINFTNNPTVQKLSIDWLYKLDGIICSIYDFGTQSENKKIIIGNYNGSHVERQYSDLYIQTEEGLKQLYINYNNFEIIRPTVTRLNLRECSNLTYFSCIGSNIDTLMLPTSIKTLNLQFCRELVDLSTNEITTIPGSGAHTNDGLDFEGLSNLKCSPYYLMQGNHMGANPPSRPYAYRYYTQHYINNISFNLMGCESATKISNLSINNSQTDFTGAFFVSGCINLEEFVNCSCTLTNLDSSFKFTYKLKEIPNGIRFSLNPSTAYIRYAFADCGIKANTNNKIKISTLLNKDGGQILNATSSNTSGVFAGMLSFDDFGTASAPLTIKWKDVSNAFGYPSWTYGPGFFANLANPTDEYFYSENTVYLAGEGYDWNSIRNRNNQESTKNIYVKFPNAINADVAFTFAPIKIVNTEEIFEGNNHPLQSAKSFVSGTKQNELINFTNCTKNNLDLSFCYTETLITGNNIIQGCKLPTTKQVTVQRLFSETDLSDFDANGVFNGITIYRANGSFMNTNCLCTGNPFTTNNSFTRNVDISAMFGIQDSYLTKFNNEGKTINSVDISWITENMITSNMTYATIMNNGQYSEQCGTFEGRLIDEFGDIPVYNTISNSLSLIQVMPNTTIGVTSQKCMFRHATINTFRNYLFTISGQNSEQIFEGANFRTSNRLRIEITDRVQSLKQAFMNSKNAELDINIADNNNLTDLSYGFYLCNGNVKFVKKEQQSNGEDPIYFRNLQNASYAFSNASAITNGTFAYEENNNQIDINIFKGCTNLKNIDKIFQYSNIREKVFNLGDCIRIESMQYAFCNSGMVNLPILPTEMQALVSMKGAFRGNTINNESSNIDNLNRNKSFIIIGNSITDVSELFAESKYTNIPTVEDPSNHLNIIISSNNLKTISAVSTVNYFDVNISSKSAVITATQPSTVQGGKLSVSTNQDSIDNQRYLELNTSDKINDNNKWYSITTNRTIRQASAAGYTLSTLDRRQDN